MSETNLLLIVEPDHLERVLGTEDLLVVDVNEENVHAEQFIPDVLSEGRPLAAEPRKDILAAMVKPAWKLSVDVFLRRVMAEIEDSMAAGATDAQSIADALNTRDSTTRNGRQWTAATINKLLSSSRASELSRAIKNR